MNTPSINRQEAGSCISMCSTCSRYPTGAGAKSPLLNPKEASRILMRSPRTLARWRAEGRTVLPFITIGRRILYRRCVVDAFIAINAAD